MRKLVCWGIDGLNTMMGWKCGSWGTGGVNCCVVMRKVVCWGIGGMFCVLETDMLGSKLCYLLCCVVELEC